MCGIAGVISWSEQHRTSRATLARMSAAIAHRGPDGEGVYFDRDPDDLSQPITPERPQVAFAFRRLAVLDPTPCSDQPFVSTDGRYVLVFNGEIYNFRELREELSRLHPEYAWRSNGDTEVVMQSYAAWGERCVEKFNGMFAFVVWDHQERSLFLARDRMGQKPLYISPPLGNVQPFAFAFSSEPPAISLVHLGWSNELSANRLAEFLQRGTLSTGLSISAHQIRPGVGAFVRSRNGREFTGRSYLDGAGDHSTRGTSAPLVNHERGAHATKIAIERAVQRQLVSDVPLGVFLSGGVDSSIIAACARKHGPVKTFSIAFADPRYDESPYAREVAEHLGTDHHEFRVTPNVIEDLPKLAAVFGEPFADSSAIPTHYLARETRKHVTVALSGDGGDELFGGYDRYVAMQKAARVPRFVGALVAPFARPFVRGHPKSNLTRIARFVVSLGNEPGDRYASYMSIFDRAGIRALLGDEARDVSTLLANRFRMLRSTMESDVTTALALDRVTYLPDDLLTKVDRCSMLHGLEVRSPFMDHELVELAAQLTEDQLLKGGKKRMLREAFASELPASVFSRPKMGFAVPIGEWFRGPLRAFLRDHLFASDSFARGHFKMAVVERLVDEHETERCDHSQRLYALLMLELWWDLQTKKE